jgi:hypothetical protein
MRVAKVGRAQKEEEKENEKQANGNRNGKKPTATRKRHRERMTVMTPRSDAGQCDEISDPSMPDEITHSAMHWAHSQTSRAR